MNYSFTPRHWLMNEDSLIDLLQHYPVPPESPDPKWDVAVKIVRQDWGENSYTALAVDGKWHYMTSWVINTKWFIAGTTLEFNSA